MVTVRVSMTEVRFRSAVWGVGGTRQSNEETLFLLLLTERDVHGIAAQKEFQFCSKLS